MKHYYKVEYLSEEPLQGLHVSHAKIWHERKSTILKWEKAGLIKIRSIIRVSKKEMEK